MRRPGIILAAVLVVAVDAIILVKAALNRSASPTTTIELTERELRLVRPQRESTALFLRLEWDPASGWFGRAKLEELGYDCRLPVTDPVAAEHYRAMPAKEAFAVLEYDLSAGGESTGSRLRAVDVGREHAPLRKKYPGALIVPSLVRIWIEKPRPDSADLRGSIVQMLVREISVPPSQRRVFESLSDTNDYFATPDARNRGPRYAATLYYGRNHEPWIGACRLLVPPAQ